MQYHYQTWLRVWDVTGDYAVFFSSASGYATIYAIDNDHLSNLPENWEISYVDMIHLLSETDLHKIAEKAIEKIQQINSRI